MTAAVARFGGRITRSLNSPEVTEATAAVRIRFVLGVVFAACGLFLSASTVARGNFPAWPNLLMLLLAVAVISGRGGRFARDWIPVVLGFLAYSQAAQAAERLHLAVHYMPQIDADRLIGMGTVPTEWLQQHLYSGRTGVLEVAALLAYLSHFFVPLGVAFSVWWLGGRAKFNTLVLALLVVSVLGEITFVLAPTAPPWLAAQSGHLPHVHQILKRALVDLHLDAAAALKGDAHAYNIVAAVPSLHVAWPVVGLLALRAYRLPRWLVAVQAAQLAAVVFAIVYAGEHYVVDALAGGLYALVAWRLVRSTLRTAEEVELRASVRGAPRVLGAIRASRRLPDFVAEEGQTLFEYAAILSLVSIVGVALLTVIGSVVNVDLSQVVGAL